MTKLSFESEYEMLPIHACGTAGSSDVVDELHLYNAKLQPPFKYSGKVILNNKLIVKNIGESREHLQRERPVE